jgi:hypothetical protein
MSPFRDPKVIGPPASVNRSARCMRPCRSRRSSSWALRSGDTSPSSPSIAPKVIATYFDLIAPHLRHDRPPPTHISPRIATHQEASYTHLRRVRLESDRSMGGRCVCIDAIFPGYCPAAEACHADANLVSRIRPRQSHDRGAMRRAKVGMDVILQARRG